MVGYFAIASIQVLPEGRLKERMLGYVEPVISAFGLRQRWNLFAPDLIRVNQYSTCLITFSDGSLMLYEWPRLEKKPVAERFADQKIRRFVTEFLARPRYKDYWPGIARFFVAARENPGQQDGKVEKVEFIFNFAPVPGFENYTIRESLTDAYRRDTVFVYDVRDGR